MIDSAQCILMVEDNPDDYEACMRAFRRVGIKNPVQWCEDGDEALDYLQRNGKFSDPASSPRPGCILLDLNLPGTDGREVLETVKADDELKDIPVIVLTTSKDSRDIEACYAAGANTYMFKPVDLHEFINAVERLNEFELELNLQRKAAKPRESAEA